MATVLLHTLHGGLRSLRDKGTAVITLLTVLGMVAIAAKLVLQWYIPAYVQGWAVVAAVLWAAGSSVALNVLVAEVDMDRVTTLSDTSYHSLLWTTTHMLLGTGAYSIAVGVTALPLLVLLDAPVVPSLPVIDVLMLSPATAALIVLTASVLAAAPAYVAVSFLLFPVFIGVENRNLYRALQESRQSVRRHRVSLLPVLLLAAAALLGVPVAGVQYAPVVVSPVAQQFSGLAVMLAEQFVTVLFAATGTVLALALLAAAYTAVME